MKFLKLEQICLFNLVAFCIQSNPTFDVSNPKSFNGIYNVNRLNDRLNNRLNGNRLNDTSSYDKYRSNGNNSYDSKPYNRFGSENNHSYNNRFNSNINNYDRFNISNTNFGFNGSPTDHNTFINLKPYVEEFGGLVFRFVVELFSNILIKTAIYIKNVSINAI